MRSLGSMVYYGQQYLRTAIPREHCATEEKYVLRLNIKQRIKYIKYFDMGNVDMLGFFLQKY